MAGIPHKDRLRGREKAPITTVAVQRDRFYQSVEWAVGDYWVAFGRPVDASTLSRRFRTCAMSLDLRLDWVFREMSIAGRLKCLLTTRMSCFYLPGSVWERMSAEERHECYLGLPISRAGRKKGGKNKSPSTDE